MPDANDNMIPDRIDRWVGLVLALVVGVLTLAIEGRWGGADVTVWLTRALGVIAVVSSVFKWGTFRAPGKGAAAALVGLLALGGAAGCETNLTACYKASSTLSQLRHRTTVALSGACREQREACLAHDKRADRYDCLKASKCPEAMRTYETIVRPSVQTSEDGVFGACETARRAKDKEASWIDKAKPGVCAAAAALQRWRDLLGDRVKPLLELLGGLEAIACKE